MDDVYKVGALCQFISSEGKKDKTTGVIKKGNVESLPIPEKNSKDSSTNADFENHKKRKSKKNVINPQLIKKKKKFDTLQNKFETDVDKKSKIKIKKNGHLTIDADLNRVVSNTFAENPQLIKKKKKVVTPQNEFETDVDKKSKKKTKKIENLTVDTNLKHVVSNTFAKTIKKQKKEKDNSVESDNKTKTFGKKNSLSKSPDIKNSAEYLEQESRTVFVGNVPVSIKMSAIKNVFKPFGVIETMRLRSVAVNNLNIPKRVSIIKKNFHPQRDTANVYIRYKTVEQAQGALQLNATEFKGHTIRVDMALRTNHKQNKKKGIFIGNLPFAIQEDEIWEFFKNCGIISAVRIVRDNTTGVCKGFGYVDFETKESVELALQLDGKKIQNRGIRIKRIESTKASINTAFNRKSVPFKKTDKPVSSQSYRGHIEPSKTQKKKPKLTKTDLTRRKIAKQLNA